MITSDAMRGFNDLLILSLLAEGDSYGYALSKTIQDLSEGKYTMKETTLYSALNRLVSLNAIEGYQGELSFGKSRTNYRITEEGRRLLSEKLQEWKDIETLIEQIIRRKV
ncbi:PadR family transcriptional regulator [Guggenheimella bovis]